MKRVLLTCSGALLTFFVSVAMLWANLPREHIAAGQGSVYGLNLQDKLFSAGRNEAGQLGRFSGNFLSGEMVHGGSLASANISAIAAGVRHGLALLKNGTVLTWGGQEHGSSDGDLNAATAYDFGGNTVAWVRAGAYNSFAYTQNQELWVRGRNQKGQLGITGDTADRTTWTKVSSLPSGNLQDLSAGIEHTLFLISGNIYGCGSQGFGQLGGTPSAVPVTSISLIDDSRVYTRVLAGGFHSLALDANHKAWAWGKNHRGQLGLGTVALTSLPTEVQGLTSMQVLDVAAGHGHSLFLVASASGPVVYAAGDNENGQLGLMGLKFAMLPTLLPALPESAFGSSVDAVVGGPYTSVLLYASQRRILSFGQRHNGSWGAQAGVFWEDMSTPADLWLSASALTVNADGGTGNFMVGLTAPPASGNVVNIFISSSNTVAFMLSPASMVFTSANWNQPQMVSVTGGAMSSDTANLTVGVNAGSDGAFVGSASKIVVGSLVQVTLPTFTLSFNSDGGSTVDDITQDFGTVISAPADPSKAGYTFIGWDPVLPGTMPAANGSHTALWVVQQFTLSFNSDGGSTVADIMQDFDTAITSPADPSKAGYMFVGWDPVLPGTMPATNGSHTALWAVQQFTLSFNSDGGSIVADIMQDFDTAITSPADPSKAGYMFVGWDPVLPGTMPAANGSHTALWVVQQFTLSFNSDGGSIVADIMQDFGTVVSAPVAPTKTGYTFQGWTPTLPGTMPAASGSHTAQWSVNQYTLSFDSAGGTSVSSLTQDFGTVVSAPVAPTKTGYTFQGWTPTLPGTMPAASGSHTAQWTVNQYTLSFDSAGGSAVSSLTQDFGTAITPPANPSKAGYVFVGWDPVLPATMPASSGSHTAQWIAPPTGLTATVGNSMLGVSWHAVAGANNHTLYWSNASGVSTASGNSATVAGNTFVITGLTNNVLVYMAVGANVNNVWTGLSSVMDGAPNTGAGSYLVVDVSGGPSALSYPVSTLNVAPDLTGAGNLQYKTDKIVLRRIPAGNFMMGSPVGEVGRESWQAGTETQHPVTLTKDFYMGVFEVTQAQYSAVMGNNPSSFVGNYKPVEQVSWDTVRGGTWPSGSASSSSFVGLLATRAGLVGVDLPTEGQWEYACRAGTTTARYDGFNPLGTGNGILDSNLVAIAWYDYNSPSSTQEVGGKMPNSFNLFDMLGGVFEWCLDYYIADNSSYTFNPVGPSSGYNRVMRGMAWNNPVQQVRAAGRGDSPPVGWSSHVGFRLVYNMNTSNQLPTVAISGNNSVPVGQQVSLTASASDPDGSIVNYEWRQVPHQGSVDLILNGNSTAVLSFTPTVSGNYRLMLTVTDNQGGMVQSTVQVQVNLVAVMETVNLSASNANGSPSYLVSGSANVSVMSFALNTSANAVLTGLQVSVLGSGAAGVTSLSLVEVSSQPPSSVGLSGRWTFDNANAQDDSGNGNHGTSYGSYTYVNSPHGKALQLDGSTGYVQVPNSGSFPTTAITMSYWFNRNNIPVSGLQSYLSKELAFQLYLKADRQLTGSFYLGTPGYWSEHLSYSVTDDSAWHLYTFSYDNNTKIAKSYINGILISQQQETDPNAIVRSSGYPLYIGRNGSASVYYVQGQMDDIYLYDRALSDIEVMALMGERHLAVVNPSAGLAQFNGLASPIGSANRHFELRANVAAGFSGNNLSFTISAGGMNFSSPHVAQGATVVSGDIALLSAPLPVYCIIDVSGGSGASNYPVSYSNIAPDLTGAGNLQYKTDKIVLRRIPAGTFMMGSPVSEVGRLSDREDLHNVTLTKDFYIGVFEVTQKQWQNVMGNNPASFNTNLANPVETVSWNTVRGGVWAGSSGGSASTSSFIGVLAAKTGLSMDLPNEAQWEYACRVGTTGALNNGAVDLVGTFGVDDPNLKTLGWYDFNSVSTTHEVGFKLDNAWGLYDMHANVGEWCLDWYNANLGIVPVTDPRGPNSGSYLVIRGGGWSEPAHYCRSAYRNYSSDGTWNTTGFRLALAISNANQLPAVAISGNGVVPVAQQVNLTASASDPDGSIVNYEWGQVPNQGSVDLILSGNSSAVLSFTPTVSGNYRLMLTVTDNQGGMVQSTVQVQVANNYVIYDSNGATGGTVPAIQTKNFGASLTLANNTGTLIKTGYSFAGWNTAANGTGTDYAVGASYTTEAAITLYAKWQIAPPTGLTATVGNSMLGVSWHAVAGANSHTLYWSNTSGVTTASGNSATVAGNTFVITGLPNNVLVYMAVGANVNNVWTGLSGVLDGAPNAGAGSYLVVDVSGGPSALSYPVSVADLSAVSAGHYAGASNLMYKTDKIVLKRILAGSFTMGNTTVGGDSTPEHTVNITRDLFAGVFELTQQQWLNVMGSYPTGTQGGNANAANTMPLHTVSWQDIRGSATGSANWYMQTSVDAYTFMGNLLAKTGLGFDLPTEAQWEYACRAGTTTAYSYGSSANVDYMWTSENSSSTTHEVGAKLPNAWGLYDVHGNVWEFCLDWYDAGYYSTSPMDDAMGALSGSYRILRGGSWNDTVALSRSARRGNFTPSSRNDNYGLRLFLPRSHGSATTTPSAPTGLDLTAGNSMLGVSWNAVAGAANTTLYWSLGSGINLLASSNTVTVTGNTFVIRGLTNGATVYTAVRARVGGTASFVSAPVSAAPSASGGDYLLVDVSGGPSALSYPVSVADLSLVNAGHFAGASNLIFKTNYIVLKHIPAGSFTMGNTTDGYTPQHTVNLTRDFFAGVFALTQQQWKYVMGSYPTGVQDYTNAANTMPMHNVSWEDARGAAGGGYDWPTSGNAVLSTSFMGQLRAKTGLGFDLPTEAQWEYSTRAGTSTLWSYGDTENGDYMWYIANNTPNGTKEVGTKLPNPWGLYDVHGNVWEWCLDWHDTYSASPTDDPVGAQSGSNRVFRGGDWSNTAASARSAQRYVSTPDFRYHDNGLRLFLPRSP